MNRFEVIVPADLGSASRLLAEDGRAALAGGVDVLDLAKQNISTPDALVNLKGLKQLSGIELRASGDVRIGAACKLSEVPEDPALRAKFTAIADAAGAQAPPRTRTPAPHLRNRHVRPRGA